MSLLRATVRWAWIRDETAHTASRRTVAFTATLYGLAFVVFTIAGWILWQVDRPFPARAFWLFGGGFTAFAGAIAVAWEAMEYLSRRRDRQRPDRVPNPNRELSPNITISTDIKIGFVVTIIALAVLFGYLYGFSIVIATVAG